MIKKDGKTIPHAISIAIESDEGTFIIYNDNASNMDDITEKIETLRSIIHTAVYENYIFTYCMKFNMNPNVSRIIRISPIKE